ncbi:MAG: hypothetical protein KDD42_00510 [Bdellovibrionales bacterium]|nr:hypothetical protein [Bdellovibrionales bacterium]
MNLRSLDRRIIYLLVALALSVPLLLEYSVPPARMASADKLFSLVEELQPQPGKIAFLALDFGPNTKAENLPQAEVMLEHLMRRRIPVAIFSLYVLAEPFLESVPEEIAKNLMRQSPGELWEYGKDWVNLGYLPGGALIVQGIPKSENLPELFKQDARGNRLASVPMFQGVKGLRDVVFLGEFTGLSGMFDYYVQFFQKDGYRPLFGHGCTSITIPEAYIYMDSGQINGLLEGIAGAAWYSERLQQLHPDRLKGSSELINTGLGFAHLIIIFLIIFGNVVEFFILRRG